LFKVLCSLFLQPSSRIESQLASVVVFYDGSSLRR
jgi:hypothetical protein